MLISGTKTYLVEPDITVFEVYGRLNLGDLLQSVEQSVHSLINSGVRKLLVDLTALNSIDSSGIGMLVSCGGQMDQLGGQMRLVGAKGAVAKVFEMVHMRRILPLDPDLASACGSFSSGTASA
jgi:anti-anti-sigma factor